MFLLHSRILEETKQKKKPNKNIRLAACLLWVCSVSYKVSVLFYLRKTKPHFSRMLPVQLPFLTQTEVLLMARRKKETLLSEAGGQVTQTHSPFQPGGRRWWFF